MAVVIRLKRMGRRRRPFFRISVADEQAPCDGRTLETLGIYDPIAVRPEAQHTVDVERARHWIGRGARVTDTVRSIFTRHGVYEGLPAKPAAKQRDGRSRDSAAKRHRAERDQVMAARKDARRKARVSAAKAAVAAGSASAE